MNLAVFGIPTDLRNRTLHIRWKESKPQNDVSESPKRQNDVLKTSEILTGKLTLKEMAVANLITADPKISIASITTKTGLSRRTIDRIISTLKEKGLLTRQGAKNNATWVFSIEPIGSYFMQKWQKSAQKEPIIQYFLVILSR